MKRVVTIGQAKAVHCQIWHLPETDYQLQHDIVGHLMQSLWAKGDLYQFDPEAERRAEMQDAYTSASLDSMLKIPYQGYNKDEYNREIFNKTITYYARYITGVKTPLTSQTCNEAVNQVLARYEIDNPRFDRVFKIKAPLGYLNEIKNQITEQIGKSGYNRNLEKILKDVTSAYENAIIEFLESYKPQEIPKALMWSAREMNIGIDNQGFIIHEQRQENRFSPPLDEMFTASLIGFRFNELCRLRNIDLDDENTLFATVLDAMIAAVIDVTKKPPINLTEFYDKWAKHGFYIDSSSYHPNERHHDGHISYVKPQSIYLDNCGNIITQQSHQSLPNELRDKFTEISTTSISIYNQDIIHPDNSRIEIRLLLDIFGKSS